jgi:hypothetical protein
VNTKALAKLYDRLTPSERLPLILAARERGDDAEAERLADAAGRITLSMSDHAPYAHAFDELATLVLLELLDDAGAYFDAFHHALEARDLFDEEGLDDGDAEEGGDETDTEADARPAADAAGGPSISERQMDAALAFGFVLRVKADGWKLFCERRNIPPLAPWKCLPGFDRLQRILTLADQDAFAPEAFVGWLNRIRRAGAPECTHCPWTAEGMADALERLFRKRLDWWGG